ncbi:MAG: MBL fold metallo-hydrolase [Marinilabiliaceae bacterium]|nr:MBL fold metallo-hydrolase [Marinilabiliaceae bacterium]
MDNGTKDTETKQSIGGKDRRIVQICSLASGSNGNAYYVQCEGVSLLVDCGISFRELSNRAKKRGIDLKQLSALFITHEHSDHVRGMKVMTNHLKHVNVYMTAGTKKNVKEYYMPINRSRVHLIGQESETVVGPFKVRSFAKPHDVPEPVSYTIEVENGATIGVYTDIGEVTDRLRDELSKCDMAFLESNYDVEMLRKGHYPQNLKDRIVGGDGHLSNRQAYDLVSSLPADSRLKCLILSHISADNNKPEIVRDVFGSLSYRMRIEVASRHDVGLLFGDMPWQDGCDD